MAIQTSKGACVVQIMEAKRREQADDAFWYSFGGHSKTMVRRCLCGGRHVEASPHARNRPFFALPVEGIGAVFCGHPDQGVSELRLDGRFLQQRCSWKSRVIFTKRRLLI